MMANVCKSRSTSSQGNSSRSPLPWFLRPVGPLISPAYRFVTDRRNQRYDDGQATVNHIDQPVISVGNISVGGTGKTPFVSWVARFLLEQGHSPVIAMRGYKADRRTGMSDEQLEHQLRLPDVPVVANPDRFEALQRFFSEQSKNDDHSIPVPDCVILDDGFQHRKLARDLDIVLINATCDPFEDRILPAGRLREHWSHLSRADAVILTHADLKNEDRLDLLCRRIVKAHGRSPIAMFRHVWDELQTESGTEPIGALAGLRVVLVCAIGYPRSVMDLVVHHGAEVIESIIRPDHAPYTPKVLDQIARTAEGADCVVTTEKDWVKIKPLLDGSIDLPVPIVRPRLEMEPFDGVESLRSMILGVFGSR